MLFLFDENVPQKFVQGLALLEEANHKTIVKAEVKHTLEFGLKGATDQEQIELAGKNDGIILSFDKDFKHMKSYYPLYKQYNIGAVVFRLSRKDSNYWGIVTTIINRWEELKIKISEVEKPFILEVTSKGIELKKF